MKAKGLLLIIFCSLLLLCCKTSKESLSSEKRSSNELSTAEIEKNDMMIDAITALETGDLLKAEKLYNSVLKKDKKNSSAMFYLANIAFQKQDIASAIEYANKSIELNGSNVWYKIQLSQIYLAIQDYDKAAQVFETIVKQEPQTLEYWQRLASLYHLTNNTSKELDVLNKMEKRFGINETFSMAKYNIYNEQGNQKNAEKEILALTKAFPNKSEYWSILAERKMKEKDYDKAFEYYGKVKQINPDDEYLNLTFANYYLVKNNEDSLYYYLQKACEQEDIPYKTKVGIVFSVYRDKVDTDTATFFKFFNLLKIMRQTQDTNECQLWSMLNLAYMRTEDMQQGAYSAQKSIELGCQNFDLYQNWLIAASTFEDPQKIISIADKCIEVYPEQPSPYLFKGVSQAFLEQTSEAINTFKQGLKLTNNKIMQEDFYANLGDCNHTLGNNQESFDCYEKVLQINPENYGVLNNYAYYLALEKKDLDKAENMAKKVVDKYPNNTTFVDTYAWVLFQKGNYRQAKIVMESTLKQKEQWSEEQKEHYKQILKKAK